MAYTTIDDPSEYFNTVLFTGNGSNDHAITGVGFKPDWVWLKGRNAADGNNLWDSNRGANNRLFTHNTNAELADTNSLKSFDSDGFTMDNDSGINGNSDTYVTWNWKANGGTATATISESGNNPAATVQANTTAGLSIITYTGTGSEGTIAHGLGASPKMIWVKNRDAGEGWIVDSRLLTGNSNGTLHFNTDAEYTGGSNQFGTHSSTNITIKTAGNINTDGQKYVAYVFAPIQGYSKFGTYTGNANADGPFVYTGFKPAWIMAKSTTATASWTILDNKRDPFNVTTKRLFADEDTAESDSTSGNTDFLSNGFKIRTSHSGINESSGVFIYMAFAEHPFVSSKGVPTTAR